jgi:hypothetical protein
MLKKKLCLLSSLLFLAIFPLTIFAAEDKAGNSIDAAKTKIEEKVPEVTKYWNAEVLPFLQQAYTNTINWLGQNMPAASKEFVSESQSLPIELWNAIKNGTAWLINFFKR